MGTLKIAGIASLVSFLFGSILSIYAYNIWLKAEQVDEIEKRIEERLSHVPDSKKVAELIASAPVRVITQHKEVKNYVTNNTDCTRVLTASGMQYVNTKIREARDRSAKSD